MAGTFDSEIRQAMTPDGAATAPKGKSAPSKGAVASSKAAPNKPPAASTPLPTVQSATMPHMQGATSDPVAHAAGIAHAILAHGGR